MILVTCINCFTDCLSFFDDAQNVLPLETIDIQKEAINLNVSPGDLTFGDNVDW